ncbi:MAG: hypothetical protein AABY53_10240 [Bdellovibrionota bacterium]
MSITQNKLQKSHLLKNQAEQVRSFIKDIGLPLNRAPEALGVKSSDFLSWWSGHQPQLIESKQLISLGRFLNIDEDQIVTGTYDKTHVRAVLFGGPLVLPDKYSKNQFSYLRSSAHVIKFLTLTRGQHFSDMIMRKLNVSPLIYSDQNNKISLNYFMDLLELLSQNGLTQDELDSLACVLFLSLGETTLGKKFKNAKTYYECYEILAQNIHLFDSNFDYSFELDQVRCKISANLHFDNHSHIDWAKARVNKLFRYRIFFVAWLPYLAKLSPVFPQNKITAHSGIITMEHMVDFREEFSKRQICPSICPPIHLE